MNEQVILLACTKYLETAPQKSVDFDAMKNALEIAFFHTNLHQLNEVTDDIVTKACVDYLFAIKKDTKVSAKGIKAAIESGLNALGKKWIIHESNISYKDKWILYDGKGQPVADDIIVSYTFKENGHNHYKSKAKIVDWSTKEQGGIGFWKIVKVEEIRPDTNGWIKYDGKGMPFNSNIRLDIKWESAAAPGIGGYEYDIPVLEINWAVVTHYRVAKPNKDKLTFRQFMDALKLKINANRENPIILIDAISEYFETYIKG